MRLKKCEADHYRVVADNYKLAAGVVTYEAGDIVKWAIERDHLDAPADILYAYHLARMSEALRDDFTLDDQGRRVRRRHCVQVEVEDPETGKLVQRRLWADDDEAPDAHILASFQQRLSAVRADFKAVQADVENIARRREGLGRRLTQMLSDFSVQAEDDDGQQTA